MFDKQDLLKYIETTKNQNKMEKLLSKLKKAPQFSKDSLEEINNKIADEMADEMADIDAATKTRKHY